MKLNKDPLKANVSKQNNFEHTKIPKKVSDRLNKHARKFIQKK